MTMINETGGHSVFGVRRSAVVPGSLDRCLAMLEHSNPQQALPLMDAAEEQLERSGLSTALKESGRRRLRNARRYFASDESSAAHWELQQFRRSLIHAGPLLA